jgi:hypothetical protein
MRLNMAVFLRLTPVIVRVDIVALVAGRISFIRLDHDSG